MTTILISGGSGLIGKTLEQKLISKGYFVTILSRKKSENPNSFYWNVEADIIDNKAITSADYIIHLAGASIADKRWTKDRKKVLIESRVATANLLFKKVKELNPKLKGFFAASGIGYYGAITSENIFTENNKPGNDFISEICNLWEKASLKFNTLNIRTVIFRTGIVFAKENSALQKISLPIKYGLGAALGSGKQYTPWIHIDDLCEMYIEAIENQSIEGIYNAVAPEQITNKQLSKNIAAVLKKPFLLPTIPAFIFKLIYGEMAVILLQGSQVSSQKIEKTGFKFKAPSIKSALENLLN